MTGNEENKQSHVSEPDMAGTYTAADYLQWKLEELVELVRGKVMKMSPSPSSAHQSVSLQLILQIGKFFEGKECRVFEAPYDVYLSHKPEDYEKARNIFQPDLLVVCDPAKIKPFGCVGAPDLVAEIISASTATKDQKDKREVYEEFGVKEYWMFYPHERSALRLNLVSGTFQTSGPFTEMDKAPSALFPELHIDLGEVFKDVDKLDP